MINVNNDNDDDNDNNLSYIYGLIFSISKITVINQSKTCKLQNMR